MKSITEIRDWLLENAVSEYGNLDISDLDFSDFDGDVFINGMRVKGNLFQEDQEVQGDLLQQGQEVKGTLYQSGQEVKGNLFQNEQEVQGNLYQGYHEVQGDYTCKNVKFKGDIFTNEPTKLLQEITTEELARMGYKLKGEK